MHFRFSIQKVQLQRAKSADVSKPFGGIPLGVKELDAVTGVAIHRSMRGLCRS